MKTFSLFFRLSFVYCFLVLLPSPFGEVLGLKCFSQPACPTVSVTPGNVSICSGCTTLTATVQGTVATSSYSVSPTPYTPYSYNTGTNVLNNIDDWFSGVITLPFCFEFYGNTYTQCIIGSNAIISFDLTFANGPNTWPISAPIPDPTVPDLLNSIMGPWHDIDPGVAGNIYYNTYGTAPCRAFVVSWDQVAMFSCNTMIATSQIVLYETTNIIDIYIQDKPLCSTWNSGAAIEGIQNSTGTQAVAVPGRNYPAQWTATNDGQRFTPTGASQYSLTWYAPPNTAIGTSLTVSVCPTANTTYTATVVNNTCGGPITVSSVATVNIGSGSPPAMTSTPTACTGNTGSATATPASGTAPFTYLWSSAPPQNTQTATGLAAGTYTVIVTDASGCSAVATVTVTSTSGLSATTSSTQTNCTSNIGTATATPNGGTAPYTYLWNNGQTAQTATGLGTGTYTVTVTDANGCITTVTASVTAPNGISSVNTTATATNCNGGNNGTSTASPSGGASPYSYLWNNGQTSQTATGLTAGNYSVTVTDANGCTFPSTAVVTEPQAMFFSSATISDTCGRKQGSATAAISGGITPYTYMWLTSPIQANPTAVGLSSGTYTCIVTDANGCTVINSASVGNVPGPGANFTPNPQVVDILNPSVLFIDLSTSDVTAWQWDFGDGPPVSTLQTPTHIYQNEGTYIITLVVTNAYGCVDSVQQTIIVEGYSTFYVPNTFTPNGDGLNDFFSPVFSRIDSSNLSILIFDRWGNEIFKTNKIGEYWNGKVKKSGDIVQEDVYVYVITYYDIKKIKHKLVGNVNVVK